MRDLAFLAALVIAVPIALARPWVGFLTYTILGFWNLHKYTWSLQQIPFALILAVATLLGLFATRDRKAIPWTRELALLLILMGYFTMTTFFAWAPESAWAQWNRVSKIYLMTFVMGSLIFGERKIRATLWVIMLGIGLFGVKGGIFSIATGGEFRVWGPENTFLEDNTSIGLAFNMVLPLLFFAAQEQKMWWRKIGLYAAGFLTIVATIFTYSRGAWVGLAITLPLLLLRMKRGILVAALMIPVALFAVTFVPEKVFDRAQTIETYEADGSAMTRLQAWSVSWNVALDHPFLGGGFNFESDPDATRWLSYADKKYDQSRFSASRVAHSIYFQVLGQHGFVAFALFIALLAFVMLSYRDIRRKALRHPELAWVTGYATALQTGLIAFLISGTFLNVAYFDLFYLYVGLVPILRREIRQCELASAKKPAKSEPASPFSPVSAPG